MTEQCRTEHTQRSENAQASESRGENRDRCVARTECAGGSPAQYDRDAQAREGAAGCDCACGERAGDTNGRLTRSKTAGASCACGERAGEAQAAARKKRSLALLRRVLSCVMAIVVGLSGISLHLFASAFVAGAVGAAASSPAFATANIGATPGGDPIELDEVRFILNHKGFEFNGGYFEFTGKKLKDVPVYVRIGGEAEQIGTRTINSDELVVIKLNKTEVENFSGELIVGSRNINLDVANYPNLQSANKSSVIPGDTTNDNDKIEFYGNNLQNIAGNIKGMYGAGTNLGGQLTGVPYSSTNATGTAITLTNPHIPGRKGHQDIYIRRETVDAGVRVRVDYQYIGAFRILEKMDTGNVTMFPNTGSKGDELYIESTKFNASNTYEVYFLKNTDGSDRPSAVNKAAHVSLGINVDGENDILAVRVPNHPSFESGTYYVLLTKVQNGQIIAETYVKTGTDPGADNDTFAVIQAAYSPVIVAIYPQNGPDTGSDVEIKAKNMITLNIPDLESSDAVEHAIVSSNLADHLQLNYQVKNSGNFTYKGAAATVSRKINMIIGKPVKFKTDHVTMGTQDQFVIRTQNIDDAESNPKRDVVVEMVTTIKQTAAPNKTYVFKQKINIPNGYEFIPSSFTPVVDSVTPKLVQTEEFQNSHDGNIKYFKTRHKLLLSIKGDKFFVYRYYDADGKPIEQRPKVLIKLDSGSILELNYQLALHPNETEAKMISYSKGGDNAEKLYLGKGFKMTVLDREGRVVDGTAGNQLGQNIILELPEGLAIKNLGSMHVQIVNPLRGKPQESGLSDLFIDKIEFVTTSDTPVIEKVEPNVVTVDGGTDVVLTGSNIASDAKLYIDGNEVAGVNREIDSAGNKVLLKFKSPKNREAITQLLVQNPSGGMAVTDFTFIKSFDKDPALHSFNPTSGTYGTVVVIDGDNYLRPDPTAVSQVGVDAYRLIGTRIQIDGRDVDVFNKKAGDIAFKEYDAPDAEALIIQEAGRAVFSKTAANATVTYHDGQERVAVLGNDDRGNPMFIAGDARYSIVYDSAAAKFRALDKNGLDIGEAQIAFAPDGADLFKGQTTVTIVSPEGATLTAFTAAQDNRVLRIGANEDGVKRVFLADYAESVTFRDNRVNMDSDPSVRYVLYYNFKGEPVLTNGKDRTYTLRLNAAQTAVEGVGSTGTTVSVEATKTGIRVGGVAVDMITPYEKNAKGVITGHVSKILSKTQLLFEVPVLHTGRGYKDLTVINPDTKRASKLGNEGFFYIPQASSKPVISTVLPKKGSVDGGYYVTISGSDFSDDAKVYVDGVEIPKEDTHVALNGRSIVIRMVKTEKKLSEDYGVDSLTVPVVVLNPDGGTASRKDGFTYIIPKSSPVITKIIPDKGSSNGGEIVEITGYEFRFYEPYTNLVGDPNYQIGDQHEDLFPNAKWDDLLSEENKNKLEELKAYLAAGDTDNPTYLALLAGSPIAPKPLHNHAFYSAYFESRVLPKVYFGENEAKIVEFTNGYIKVITPPHASGQVDVYVINNDSGVSNKVKYTYESTKPVIDKLIPNFGKRGGSEPKELFGSKMYPARELYGYTTDSGAVLVEQMARLTNVDALIRFGTIDNTRIPRIEPNSGLINNQRTTVNLEGGLTLQFYGDLDKIKLSINERNTVYSREFKYDETALPSEDGAIFLPVGMLKDTGGRYYVPTGLMNLTEYTNAPTVYKQPYEYIKVYIEDRRMMVERGYAPKVVYESDSHVTVYTPSYHTIGKAPMVYYNPDGGVISKEFEYTNPASEPKILKIEPQTLSHDEKQWLVESSVLGGIDIEIIGLDFRPNLKVSIGDKSATVKELTTKTVNGKSYDLAVVTVPKGADDEIGRLYPIMISNEDSGLATSNNVKDLIGPNHGSSTLPFYFVYRKPLSFPSIKSVLPTYTSVAGGNTMVITGSDFRAGCYVIIGTRAGIPIYSGVISDQGTKITFQTPTNMTLGKKDIQVLNTDYGTGVVKDAIHVVSAPTVDGDFYDEDGRAVSRIHVTGGQKIVIKGSGFAPGATVFFGGEWVKAAQNPENKPGADEGLYRDDVLYTVKNGVKATAVEFVDEKTLKVTTPAVTKEGGIRIVVLNKDGGISDDSATLDYRVPIPSDPTGLKATIVDNRYIKLYDYVAQDAKYFEIYAYIGNKTNEQLIKNKHQDFAYLGVTEVEPYKIIDLPGWEKMGKSDRIVFVVKAVNKFGQSGYSNLAHLYKDQLKDVKELGPEDLDGDLGVKKGKDYEHKGRKGESELLFAKTLKTPLQEIDLRGKAGVNMSLRRIAVPEEIVRGMGTLFSVLYGDTMIRFSSQALNTAAFREMDLYADTYGIVQEEVAPTAPTVQMRGMRKIGKVYKLSFGASSNEERKSIMSLEREVEYSIRVPEYAKNPSRVEMHRYDESKGRYVKLDAVYDARTGMMTVKTGIGGYFVLIEPLN